MGLRLSWIGVKNADRSSVLEALGLAELDEPARLPPIPLRARLTAFEYGGWFYVLSHDTRFASRERIASVSHHGLAVGAYLEEHVMVSGAFGGADGRLVWSAQHDPNVGEAHLDVWGDPPDSLGAIQAKLTEDQRAESEPVDHLFDAPAEVAASVCGFNPNEVDGDVELIALDVVRRDLMKLKDQPLASEMSDPGAVGPATPPPKRGWLERLLGGR